MVFGVGKASAATVYAKPGSANPTTLIQYKSGAISCDDASGWTDDKDLEDALGVASTNGTLNICAGTYSGTMIDSADDLDAAYTGQTIQGIGTVILTGVAGGAAAITVRGTNTTINDITILNASNAVEIRASLTVTLNRVVALGSTGYAFLTTGYANTVVTFNDCTIGGGIKPFSISASANWTMNRTKITGNTDVSYSMGSMSAGTLTMNYCSLDNNVAPIALSGTGILIINDSLFIGNRDGVLKITGGTATLNNIIAVGNSTYNNGTYPITRTGGTLNINNSLLLPNGMLPETHFLSGAITETNDIYLDPKFVSPRRFGWVSLFMDDKMNWEDMKALATYANSKGVGIVGAMDRTYAITSGGFAEMVTFINAGNEIAVHTRNHFQYHLVNFLTIDFKTTATTPHLDISIDQSNANPDLWTGTITIGDTGSENTVINISNITTIADVVTIVTARTGWSTTALNTSVELAEETFLASYLNDVADKTTFPYTALVEQDKFWYAEIAVSKADLEKGLLAAGITYVVKTFVSPGNRTNATLQAWLANDANFTAAGTTAFTIARGGSSNSFTLSDDLTDKWHPTSFGLNIMEVNVIGSEEMSPNTVRDVTAQAALLTHVGGYNMIVGHSLATTSLVQWQNIIDTFLAYSGMTIVLPRNAANTIRTGGLWTDADANGLRWTHTFTNTEDYRLQPTSPAIDSGTPISGLTTDFSGNPIYGLPDIGGYEYQPNHDMAAATPDEPQIGEAIRVYGNGKFRNTIDDSEDNDTDTAKLSIVPQSTATTKWLDLNITAWNNSGTYQKEWTENSTNITGNVNHTVGDLEANKYYSVYVDSNLGQNITGANCTSGVCTADENGEIIFTYNGGYSEHTFTVEDATPPTITITSPEIPEEGDTVSGDDTITFTDTEETNPECSIDNTNWINCTSTVTSFNDLTGWDTINESDTFTLYIKDTDASNNTGTANVANLTKADTQAPIRSNGSPEGELSSSTTQTSIGLNTSESAVCKYSTTEGTAYSSMTDVFANVDGTAHTETVSGLSSGISYSYYVRCQDESENANDTDYLISFSIAAQSNDENTDENNNNERDLNLHNLKFSSTQDSITLTWKTDHNTKSTIRYGTDRNLKEKKKDNQKEKKHKAILKDLLPNTKYYFRIKATDSDDNEDSSNIHSIKTQPAKTQNLASLQSSDAPLVETPHRAVFTRDENSNSKPNICNYTVQPGDTLWSIAKKVYGDATAYTLIIDKNKDKYTDIESRLSIGQELSFCDNNQALQNTGNNLNTGNPNQQPQSQNQTQPQTQTKTFHWWNPLSWF